MRLHTGFVDFTLQRGVLDSTTTSRIRSLTQISDSAYDSSAPIPARQFPALLVDSRCEHRSGRERRVDRED